MLQEAGATVIVLLDHAQDFTADPLSTSSLRGIQVIVAAGSTGFMANTQSGPDSPFNALREGDEGSADYPTIREDSEGETVVVVNSDQLYAYIGHLIIEFDADGRIIEIDERSGPIATTEEVVALMANELGVDSLETIPEVREVLDTLQATPSIQSAFEVVGSTENPLNGARADVRGRETNLARVVADSTLAGGNAYAAANGIAPIDVALKNGGGIRDSIIGPQVTRLTIRAALAFDNKLALIELTGEQLLAAMENAVSRVPAADGRFPQVANMNLIYDETRPGVSAMETLSEPSRIEFLSITKADGTVDELVVDFAAQGDLSRTFTMATNSFLLTGGDGYAALTVSTELGETDIGEQQILEEFIVNSEGGTIDVVDPPPDPRVSKSEGMVEPSPTEPSPTDAPAPTDGPAPTEAPAPAPTVAPAPTDAPAPAPSDAPSGVTSNMAVARSVILTVTVLAMVGSALIY